MRFLIMSLVYAGLPAVFSPLHARVQLGGKVGMVLYGVVQDGDGLPMSGARVIFHGSDTILTTQDGSFAKFEDFFTVGGPYHTMKFPYTVEKEGYDSVSDTAVVEWYQVGSTSVNHDMGTITLYARGQKKIEISITLHGTVKDESGAAISGARVTFYRDVDNPENIKMKTVLSARDGSFSLVQKFPVAGGGHKIYDYTYLVEKAGYVSVRDTVVMDMSREGKLVAVRDMGTITLSGGTTALRRGRFLPLLANSRQASEAVYTVTGRKVSHFAGTPARLTAFQPVIRRNAPNR
jgi:hypothetical protein